MLTDHDVATGLHSNNLQAYNGMRGSDVFIMLHVFAMAIGGYSGGWRRHNGTSFGSSGLRALRGALSYVLIGVI